LNVANAVAALNGPWPPADRYEPNDDAGVRAFTLWGTSIRIAATLDYWDDPVDVYRVRLRARERITLGVHGPGRADTDISLWRPGTRTVAGILPSLLKSRVAATKGPGATKRLSYRAPAGGWYYAEVKLGSAGFGPYTLTIAKS